MAKTEEIVPIGAADWKKDDSKLKDNNGRYLTQGLFLEIGYGPFSIFTLSDRDKLYKGKVYPSLKRLYLEEADVVEINFANKYLWGWDQWQKMNASEVLRPYFDKWRDELSLMVQSDAIGSIIDQSLENSSAAKWLAARGWDQRKVGRPSKLSLIHI